MTATFNWAQTNGTSGAESTTELGGSGNVVNFQSADVATPGTYSSNVVTASDSANAGNSKEIWLRGHWTGTFTTIDTLKFWKSADFATNPTGITVKYACTATYATPTSNDSAITTGQTNTATIPTSTPGSANIGIANSLSGQLVAAGYSDYIVLQAHVATTATAGASGLATFTLQANET